MTFVQSQKNETSEIRGLPSYAWWKDLVKYLLESLSYFWIRKPIYIGLFFFHLLSLYFTCITSIQNWFWKTRIHRYEIPGLKNTELGWFIFIIRRFSLGQTKIKPSGISTRILWLNPNFNKSFLLLRTIVSSGSWDWKNQQSTKLHHKVFALPKG